MHIESLLRDAASQLNSISETPALDAELLLMHLLNVPRSYLYMHAEQAVDDSLKCQYHMLIQKRKTGFPVAYLLGKKSFWSLDLTVTEDTLIPRPETELIVELVLKKKFTKNDLKILDLGTGSGAIALAIASEKPHWHVDAVDISIKALDVARKNAKNLKINNINFIQSNWFLNIRDRYDVIVSNPPYLSENDPYLLGDIRYEPIHALVAKDNGLEALNILAQETKNYLKPEGLILLEHGCQQGEVVRILLQKNGFSEIETLCDLENRERVTTARMQN